MSNGDCEHTEAVLAAGSEALPPELRRHARFCPACADALLVDAFLAQDAAALAAAARARVPDAGAVWLRARHRIDAEAVERATRPIVVFRRLAWVAGLAAGGGVLARLPGDGWRHALARLGELGEGLRWELPSPVALESEAALVVAGALALATALFGLYTSWAEEA